MLRPGSKIIATNVRKPKRGAKKRQAAQPAAITAPAVVKARKPKPHHVVQLEEARAPRPDPGAMEPPANDDRKSAIVTTTSRKWSKLRRVEQALARRASSGDSTE
jgi:hypothetical protein